MDSDCTHISYRDTNSFSELAIHYSEGGDLLRDFYQFQPNEQGVADAIAARNNFGAQRSILKTVLQQQYEQFHTSELVKKNIEALGNSNTYTICTAHQPNLMSGYLYFFYKILHAIKMAEDLNQKYPDKHFVPVYYMGSEDNDLDELGQFWYEGERYRWDADGQSGAVGRMNTASLKNLITTLFRKLGPPGAYREELIALITEAYLGQKNISLATLYLVNQLFGHYGLVVLNPDNAVLKNSFSDIIRDELLHQKAYNLVQSQSERLDSLFKAQAFPRPINLFYLKDGLRERIEQHGQKWQVLNTSIQFSQEELLQELKQYPERFSPNVILRGLFQEFILPNICFIGGGAEIAYWLQFKPLFDHYNVFYPVLFLRQSVQIINEKPAALMQQLNLSANDIFLPKELLIRAYLKKYSGITWDLGSEKRLVEEGMEKMLAKAVGLDPTLEQSVAAALAKMKKQMDITETKMYRAQKRKEVIYVQKIERLLEDIRPRGGLQERIENFMPYYLQFGFRIFDLVKHQIRAFDQKFLVIYPRVK